MNWTWVQKLMAGVLLVAGLWNGAQAQVREYTFTPDTTAGKDGMRTEGAAGKGQTVDLSGQVLMTKGVPRNPGMEVKGDGKPRALYVVQLARFEFMEHVPEAFPKGTFLWINPDLRSEKFLLAGFFETFEDADIAAREWKKQEIFEQAFARPKPFMVLYE